MNHRPHIFCPVRKKWLLRTPEEEVRQQVIGYLNINCGAPFSLMAVEYPLELNGLTLRADLVLHNRRGAPALVAEFKAPQVSLGTQAFEQLRRYNTLLRAPYLMVSNGETTYVCHWDGTQYVYIDHIPTFDALNA